MDPMTMMALATLGSAAAGGILGKYQGDREAKAFSKAREKDLKREVALTPWSPWGPLKPERTTNARPDPMHKAMQSAMAFGQMGQNVAMSNAWMNQNKGGGAAPQVTQGPVGRPYDYTQLPQGTYGVPSVT